MGVWSPSFLLLSKKKKKKKKLGTKREQSPVGIWLYRNAMGPYHATQRHFSPSQVIRTVAAQWQNSGRDARELDCWRNAMRRCNGRFLPDYFAPHARHVRAAVLIWSARSRATIAGKLRVARNSHINLLARMQRATAQAFYQLSYLSIRKKVCKVRSRQIRFHTQWPAFLS